MAAPSAPKLAVWKFASCDGCQLSLIDCGEELLAIGARFEIAHFTEASRTVIRGPYDLSLVEGSIATAADLERIQAIRRQSRWLVSIGACATAGGIQALRNDAVIADMVKAVYPRPECIDALATSTPIADHVAVDFALQGCPIDRGQLIEVISAFLSGRKPNIPTHSLCLDCKRGSIVCVMVARGLPCLGPVTQAGCGVLCPSVGRGCYGCFGPMEAPNTAALRPWLRRCGLDADAIARLYRTFNAGAVTFRAASDAHD
ncbi:MAG: oxidoreductase [Defluviicoccus sp.]